MLPDFSIMNGELSLNQLKEIDRKFYHITIETEQRMNKSKNFVIYNYKEDVEEDILQIAKKIQHKIDPNTSNKIVDAFRMGKATVKKRDLSK